LTWHKDWGEVNGLNEKIPQKAQKREKGEKKAKVICRGGYG